MRFISHIASIVGVFFALVFTKPEPWPVFLPVVLIVVLIMVAILTITELCVFLKPILYWRLKRYLIHRSISNTHSF